MSVAAHRVPANFVADTSALIAVAVGEPDAGALRAAFEAAAQVHVSSVSKLEIGIVATQRNVFDEVMQLMDAFDIQVQPFDDVQCGLAIAAFLRFGKGRHPAGLNFGDCCAYALATSLGWPLLYKGEDFSRTDIASALA